MDPQRIAERYDVLREIGRGGMGAVWLCHDTVLGRDVAVKQIGALPGESATETRRAMREARSAAALNHPNAVAVYDVVDHHGAPWLVMEYVDGETLADVIAREGRLAPQRAADIGAHLASALARAHERGIVHRDVKPGNVLIDRTGRPKISDFGIARGHGDDQLTQTGFVTGTPGYLSPQLARGGDPDSASDVWALGATLYAAVEGRAPYEPRSNPIAVLQAIATEPPRPMEHAGPLRGAITAMMAEPPGQWDMATAAEQLGRVARGDSTLALPSAGMAPTEVVPAPGRVDPTQRLSPAAAGPAAAGPPAAASAAPGPSAAGQQGSPAHERRGRPWLPGLLALLLLVALGGGAYWLSQQGDEPGGSATDQTTATTTAPAQTTSSAPTTETATSPSSSPETTATDSPPATTTAPTTASRQEDQRLEKFVRDYFKDVTRNPDKTWELLTPAMQESAGGRDSYTEFWESIDSVKVNELRGNAGAKNAIINLTYQRDEGEDSTETHQLTLVEQDGDYLIDSDETIG